ncbi:hypothetical protein GDO86_015785 [Hymenochirus boettgeri]|uniref:Uncharacterized protein n=1 Tax=Hymenochirus boettgeri TaxID=247094 RepID=A0A8T2JYQ1_9PIPI|nr:hypothetical protein GDO86_015785 [Hymenochirus boettgeri]
MLLHDYTLLSITMKIWIHNGRVIFNSKICKYILCQVSHGDQKSAYTLKHSLVHLQKSLPAIAHDLVGIPRDVLVSANCQHRMSACTQTNTFHELLANVQRWQTGN